MKHKLLFPVIVFATVLLSFTAAAQHRHTSAGSIAAGWDGTCTSAPVSHSDYPWNGASCGGASCTHSGACTSGRNTCDDRMDCAGGQSCGSGHAHVKQSKYGASWCQTCSHEHCLPGHLYAKNCSMIDALQATYCVSTKYLVSLRERNNQSYRHACATGGRGCPTCAPPRDYARRGTLEDIHGELAGLKQRCDFGRE